jgi:DNA-binding MarR family transcriptional regulator
LSSFPAKPTTGRRPQAPPPLLGALLRIPADHVHRRIIEGLRERGFDDLTAAHMPLFRWPGPEGRRPSELAAEAGMSRQAYNYLLGQLEERGYVERRPDAGDRRSKRVHLTDRGRALVPATREIVREVEREWARDLGADDLEQLRGLLERLVGVLRG